MASNWVLSSFLRVLLTKSQSSKCEWHTNSQFYSGVLTPWKCRGSKVKSLHIVNPNPCQLCSSHIPSQACAQFVPAPLSHLHVNCYLIPPILGICVPKPPTHPPPFQKKISNLFWAVAKNHELCFHRDSEAHIIEQVDIKVIWVIILLL